MTVYPRNVHFDSGIAMIVTDLHGEGQAYSIIRERFLSYYESGMAQRLVICGDLIHGYGAESDDQSVEMLLDVMDLQQQLGEDVVVLLMGNHEMPHLYGVTLSKGNLEFTPRFERQLQKSGQREAVKAYLSRLPFYATTAGGVLLTHAGASPIVLTAENAERLLTFDHDAVLQLADDRLRSGYDLNAVRYDSSYREQVAYYLAIQNPDDPRYLDLLRGHYISQRDEEFQFLWEVLFTQNEMGISLDVYQHIVERFLAALAPCLPIIPQVIVAGHIGTRGGHELIGERQLRLASYAHASPRHKGEYLLLDCAAPIQNTRALIPYLRPTLPSHAN